MVQRESRRRKEEHRGEADHGEIDVEPAENDQKATFRSSFPGCNRLGLRRNHALLGIIAG
jgi:hypothetical protein